MDKTLKNENVIKIDTNRIANGDIFFQFIAATDSTSRIKWGDSKATYISESSIDNYYLEKEKMFLKWYNEKFISLTRGTGSDSWVEIILPRHSQSDIKLFQNTLAIDKENGIVVYEYPSEDSSLIAENIITNRKIVIGSDWKNCSSAFPHYCIDSISLKSKKLYIEWVTPSTYEEKSRDIINKKINL